MTRLCLDVFDQSALFWTFNLIQVLEIYRKKKGDHHDSKKLDDSLPSREEEEKHQKLLAENEELKKQIQEVSQENYCVTANVHSICTTMVENRKEKLLGDHCTDELYWRVVSCVELNKKKVSLRVFGSKLRFLNFRFRFRFFLLFFFFLFRLKFWFWV